MIYKAQGKLLLTSEYFVLDGATALAAPSKYGQTLSVLPNDSSHLSWKSIDHEGNCWFETIIDLPLRKPTNDASAIKTKLIELLLFAQKNNNSFLHQGYDVTLHSDFPLNWGLGSSSTLVSVIAQWAAVNPYAMQFHSFGGSGYDIACATAQTPVLYQKLPQIQTSPVEYSPPFKPNMAFVYLGKKQNSREGIAHYKSVRVARKKEIIARLDELTSDLIACTDLDAHLHIISEHEAILSGILQMPTVKSALFSDFQGEVKSLGAWGGDFVWASGNQGFIEMKKYFEAKEYKPVLSWSEMFEN